MLPGRLIEWVRHLLHHRFLFCLGLLCAAACGVSAQPTNGFSQYNDTFYVQKPWDLPLDQRYADTGGMYTTWILPGDKPFNQTTTTGPRTEMRWNNWANQKVEHLFDADVMYEPGTNHTCIMQIKSNTNGEALYMQVHTNGDLRNSTGTPFLTNYAGKWFNLKVTYNPVNGVGRVWIDNVLKITASHSGATDWYFKNGTYNNGMTAGSVSKAHFKNMKMWIYTGASDVRLAAKLRHGTVANPIQNFVFNAGRDLRGRVPAKIPLRLLP